MKIKQGTLKKSGFIVLLAAILMTSCVPMKRIRYLQEPNDKEEVKNEYEQPKITEYLIHEGDNLFIRVKSLDEKNNFLDQYTTYNNYYTESGIYLNSYTVNDSGYVEFPLIGKIFVDNFTIEQIRKKIQDRVDEYVKNTVVIVKLANFRIAMLGEFNHPGKYVVYQDKINIFEAISMAGDMTDFAKKNRVLLLRESKEGVKTYRLNLNDRSLLTSDFYYLMPNDMVYVEPMKGKQFAFSEFPYLLILTTLTTTVLLLNYFGK